jgi:hypothetical protein
MPSYRLSSTKIGDPLEEERAKNSPKPKVFVSAYDTLSTSSSCNIVRWCSNRKFVNLSTEPHNSCAPGKLDAKTWIQ